MNSLLAFIAVAVAMSSPAPQAGMAATIGDVDEYLMDEEYEVALALSAGPAYVSDEAAVLVFTGDGYEEARAGTNGFTCLVERSWSSPIGPHEDFFNPNLRAPICFNAEASRVVLADYLRRTELAIGGKSIGEIEEAIKNDIATGNLRAPRQLAMSYMLSGGQRLGTATGRFKPHLMFYVPYATGELLGDPPLGCEHACMFEHAGSPLAALIVPVAEFNDAPEERGRR